MLKRSLILIIGLLAWGVHAQNNTVSPYSYFGLGEYRNISTVENQMMARLSMYSDSIHLNLNNPAGYGKLKLTTYAAALSHKELRLESFTESQNTSVTNLDYLALGFPISPHVGLGLGLKPYTSVGYNLIKESTNQNGSLVTNEFSGEGGLNQVYLSIGFQLARNLHLGTTLNLNFGTLDNRREQRVENVQFGTVDDRSSEVSGVDFNYGLTYTPSLSQNLDLFTSVTVNTQGNLVSENSQRIGSFSTTSGREIETIDVNLDAQGLRRTEIKVPTKTTLGLGIGKDKSWFVGGEYSFQGLSDFRNEFLQAEDLEYQDATTMALGVFYVPDFASFNRYFNRVTYRAGVRMENTGMVLRDKEIKNFGITFGLGLPLGANFSNLNIGFELGTSGTSTANLIEEDYLKVSLGLSFNDRWFQKRKIN